MTAPLMTRRADFAPSTFNADAGTVEAVASTFAPVQRTGFLERLDPSAINPADLVGLPVLDGHRQGSARDVVGSVTAARMDGQALIVTIRRTTAPDADPIWARVADKTVRGVSIGYSVRRWRDSNEGGQRVRTASDWTIREISVVASPADPNATFRSENMPEDLPITPAPEDAERTRRSEIRTLVRAAQLGLELADDLIDQNADLNAAKAAVFDAMQARSRSTPVIRVHGSSEDPAVIRERQADALYVRMAGGEPKPEVRAYMGESLLDVARGSLARVGVSTRGMAPDEVFTRAGEHTTSDFPLLVSNAMNKTALAAYTAAQSPLKQLGRQVSLSNFKVSTALRLGEMGRLEELDESGEITATSRAEGGESMSLKTYARRIDVSRKLLIDDDLGMLGDMTSAFGEAAAQTEADVLVALVTGNPNMADGNPVFSTGRGNEAATGVSFGDATEADALSEARLHFRQLTGLDGETLISVPPKFLLVGPESETAAEKLLSSIYPATTVDVQPIKFTLLVEPRISGASWYVFSDPARLAAFRYGYLSSAQGVQIQRQEAWNTLGLSFRAFLDFGAGWLDWRAAWLNPGS